MRGGEGGEMGEDVRREAQRLIEKDERTDGRNQDRGPTRHRHTHARAHTPEKRERAPNKQGQGFTGIRLSRVSA